MIKKISLFYLLFSIQIGILTSQELVENTYKIEMVIPEILNDFSRVSEVVEDNSGYLWFTSRDGLSCYDGQKLTTYNNNYIAGNIEIGTVGNGYFQCLTTDSVHIWFGEHETNNLICFNTSTREIVQLVTPVKDEIDFIYLSKYGEKIYYYSYALNDPLSYATELSNEVDDSPISFHHKEAIHDYYYFNNEHWLMSIDSIYRYNAKGIYIDALHTRYNRSGTEVFSNDDAANYIWNKATGIFEQDFVQPSYFGKRAFEYHKFGDVYWTHNDNRELVLYDPIANTVQDYSTALNELATAFSYNSLKERINQVLQLRDGDFLAVTETSIFRLSPKEMTENYFKETISSGRAIASMRAITESPEGDIYASYYTGVSVKKPGGSFEVFEETQTAAKRNQRTYSLNIKDDLLFWNHTIFDLKTGKRESLIFDMYGSHCTQLIEGDTMWIYFWEEVTLAKYVIPSRTFTIIKDDLFDIDNVEMSDFIRNDNNQNFLVATNTQGIREIDRAGNLVKLYSKDLLKSRLKGINGPVFCMHQNGDDLWYGTSYGVGLLNLKDESVSQYQSKYFTGSDGGQIARNVYFMLPTEDDNLYLGTSRGFLYFDIEQRSFSLLPDSHPLANKEYNRNSSYKTKDGRYYVGTVDGLYSFMPADLSFEQKIKEVAPPFISHFQIFNNDKNRNRFLINELNTGQKIKLKPSDFSFKADFSSLIFKDQVYYSYRIVGVSDVWSSYSTSTSLEIYSLPAGDYTLEMKSTLDPLHEPDNIRQLLISKAKVWYAHWWVQGLFVIGFLGLISLLLRYRYQQKLNRRIEMENYRTKVSSDLHDDVGSILAGLAIQSELTSKMVPEAHQNKLLEISQMSRSAMELMRDTVWAMDPRKDKYENLIDRMTVFAEASLSRKDINFTIDTDEVRGQQIMKPTVRKNIYLIFKEAITNIVKHADTDKVVISFKKEGDMIKLSIWNDIKLDDFSNKLSSDGQGLLNMKMRAKQIGGSLEIFKDNGFEVRLTV